MRFTGESLNSRSTMALMPATGFYFASRLSHRPTGPRFPVFSEWMSSKTSD